ncbi:acyltransferase family protein [Aquabacterium sp.]|uniref:acyltransferase family protein n=1 Tax=Aquabacterium sp. TaxID=1872578 RepID=UPI0035B12642
MASEQSYRRDIDGLRMLAIVPVVIFHAFPALLPGGFIGVDIFFVISGYLISGILLKQLQADQFRIRTFYAHRVRRIFPALITVLLTTFILGWFFATPDDLKLIGKHMATGAGFVQNFALLQEAGYFDVASETKPLLHLWSLAIEEQFYLVYPPTLWLLWRLNIRLTKGISLLAFASFIASLVWIQIAPTQAFFLPYPRMWELLAGGLLAAWPIQSTSHKTSHSAATDIQSIAGLGVILIGLTTITEGTSFPGWQALLPVLGAALILHAGPDAWVNKHILSRRLPIGIGLISYPLYLWHWPLLAFLHITNSATTLNRLYVVGTSFLLAWLTYQLIERPIRPRRPTPLLIGSLCMLMIGMAYVGINTLRRDGMPFRFNGATAAGSQSKPAAIAHMTQSCPSHLNSAELALAECWEDSRAPAKVAIVGDSKAKALAHGILEHSTTSLPWMFLGGTDDAGSLVPVISSSQGRARNQKQIADALHVIESRPGLKVIVITTATRALYQLPVENSIEPLDKVEADIETDAESGLNQFIDQLIRLHKQIILIADNPSLNDPRRCMTRTLDWQTLRLATHINSGAEGCSIALTEHRRQSRRYQAFLSRVQNRHPADIKIFDLPERLCDRTRDLCTPTLNGVPLYSFTDHISNEAGRLIAPQLLGAITQMLDTPH